MFYILLGDILLGGILTHSQRPEDAEYPERNASPEQVQWTHSNLLLRSDFLMTSSGEADMRETLSQLFITYNI